MRICCGMRIGLNRRHMFVNTWYKNIRYPIFKDAQSSQAAAGGCSLTNQSVAVNLEQAFDWLF